MNDIIPNRAGEIATTLSHEAKINLLEQGFIINPYLDAYTITAFNRIYNETYLIHIFEQGKTHQPKVTNYTLFGAYMAGRLTVLRSLGISVSDEVWNELYEQAWADWCKVLA